MGDRERPDERRTAGPLPRPPQPAPPTHPLPSLAAYRRHKRHKEPVCDGCRQVYNTEQRRLYALRVKGKQ